MVLSFTAMALTAVAFMITGKEILGAAQDVPSGQNVLTYQCDVLGVVHPVFRHFYVVAIIMVFLGTMYAIWEVNSRTSYESLPAVSAEVSARCTTRAGRPAAGRAAGGAWSGSRRGWAASAPTPRSTTPSFLTIVDGDVLLTRHVQRALPSVRRLCPPRHPRPTVTRVGCLGRRVSVASP